VWADANIVKLVFVINDTETETYLRKNGAAWSRLSTPIVVEDLCRNEALAFLSEPPFCHSTRREVVRLETASKV